jgi:hypothetical protein
MLRFVLKELAGSISSLDGMSIGLPFSLTDD